MRKITMETGKAFNKAMPFKESNTEIIVLPNVTIMKLFGNNIAYKYNDPQQTLSITNCGYSTPTTKDRLNAIDGVNIVQRNNVWYLNGKEWDGELIDVNI